MYCTHDHVADSLTTLLAQRLSEIQPKQDSPTGVFSAAKKIVSPDIIQSSVFNMFQDNKPATSTNTAVDSSVTWSSALSEQASAAKSQSPSTTTQASRALSSYFPMSKGIIPITSNQTVANVTPSPLQLVSSNVTSISDRLITVTPLYTLSGSDVILHKNIQPPSSSSMQQQHTPIVSSTLPTMSTVASLLNAACKQTPSSTTTQGFNFPTIGQLLQSQLLTMPQKTEQNP